MLLIVNGLLKARWRIAPLRRFAQQAAAAQTHYFNAILNVMLPHERANGAEAAVS